MSTSTVSNNHINGNHQTHSSTAKSAVKCAGYGAIAWATKAAIGAVPGAIGAAVKYVGTAAVTGAGTGAAAGAAAYATYKVGKYYLKDR